MCVLSAGFGPDTGRERKNIHCKNGCNTGAENIRKEAENAENAETMLKIYVVNRGADAE